MKTLKAIQNHWDNILINLEKELIEMIKYQTHKYNPSFYRNKYYPCDDNFFRIGNSFGVQYRYLHIDQSGLLKVNYVHGQKQPDGFHPDGANNSFFTSFSLPAVTHILSSLVPHVNNLCEVFEFNGAMYLYRNTSHMAGGKNSWVNFVEESWESHEQLYAESNEWYNSDSRFYGSVSKHAMLTMSRKEFTDYVNSNFD